ncbi:MAG: diphthamide synthesis protein [Candidatus Woesearchaeota archaeon]
MEYDLELNRVVATIKKQKAKLVCIQLPDGLKPLAGKISDEISAKTKAKVLIWAGSCFGSCDLPQGLEKLGVDLLIQWGHSP